MSVASRWAETLRVATEAQEAISRKRPNPFEFVATLAAQDGGQVDVSLTVRDDGRALLSIRGKFGVNVILNGSDVVRLSEYALRTWGEIEPLPRPLDPQP